MTPALEVRGLRAGYGIAADILHGIDLDVPRGAAVGISGANGAGKSSLLRVLAGLHPPRAGDVRLTGNDIGDLDAGARLRRGVAFLPEGHRVIRSLTVEENLRLAAISEWPRGVNARMAAVLPMVHDLFPVLRDRRKQLAGLLSGGEQQMVSIGRALISQPRLLLLDEPSLGLAPVVIERIYQSLEHLKNEGISMLIVEQDYARLSRLCDQVHVLRLGALTFSSSDAAPTDHDIRVAYFGRDESDA